MSAARPPRYLPPHELARWAAELEARCDGLEAIVAEFVKRVAELEAVLDQTDDALNVALEELVKLKAAL